MTGADIHPDALELIEILGLTDHPEGGFYRETFRSPLTLRGLPWLDAHAERSASTAIYFLLPAGRFSAFHRVMADEVWHHYAGDPIELHTLGATMGTRSPPRPRFQGWGATSARGPRGRLPGCGSGG